MVKKQAETPIEEEKVKRGSFKKALIKLLALFILAAAAYGLWKNPAFEQPEKEGKNGTGNKKFSVRNRW